jgi:hypothetical protein
MAPYFSAVRPSAAIFLAALYTGKFDAPSLTDKSNPASITKSAEEEP